MQGFESSFRRHLAVEQRRAILEAIAETLDPDATVGEVLDAAERLGLGEQIGAFSLAEIAAAMVGTRPEAPAHQARPAGSAYEDDEDDDFEDEIADEDDDFEDDAAGGGEDDDALEEDDAEEDDETYEEDDVDEEDDDEIDEEVEDEDEYTRNLRVLLGPEKLRELQRAEEHAAPVRPSKAKKKGSKKKASASAKVSSKKVEPVVVAKSSKAEDGRKRAARLRALRKKIDAEERMSLDEAAELFIPIVTELGQATMQDLEEFTGVGRRKLRFHVGQLVRHEYLARHGMGRGTYYTVG